MPPDVLPRRAGPLRFLGSSFIFEPLHYGFGNLFSTYENEARVKRRAPCETGRMRVVAVIPARLASTRLPRKMLREIAGVPLLTWVYRGVRRCSSIGEVIVATDSDEIMQFCEQQGFAARMTSPAHRSGTERVHEISTAIPADVYLNVQGDEPLTRPEHLESLITVMNGAGGEGGTLKTAVAEIDVNHPNAVKVVTHSTGRALYFSRATIPYD